MLKLTKAQQKDRDRIEAWLKQEPFRENSRSKPEIPDLSLDEVIETYVPPDIQGAGQFFTPLQMANAAYGYLNFITGRMYASLSHVPGSAIYSIRSATSATSQRSIRVSRSTPSSSSASVWTSVKSSIHS